MRKINYKLPQNLHNDDKAFYQNLINKNIPKAFRQKKALELANSYDKYYTESSFIEPTPFEQKTIEKGRRAANLSHLYNCEKFKEAIDLAPFWFARFNEKDYSDIANYATELAIDARKTLSSLADNREEGMKIVKHHLGSLGIEIEAKTFESFWLKVADESLLRQKMHRNLSTQQDEFARRTGEYFSYVSNQAQQNRDLQKERQNSFLEDYEVSDGEKSIPMKDIKEQSDKGFQAELIARLAGLKNLQEQNNMTAAMITLTCPSEYHSKKKIKAGKNADGKPKYILVENTKYDNTKTIKDGWNYIHKTYRDSVKHAQHNYFKIAGMIAAQPHQDGTAHAHMFVIGYEEEIKRLASKITKLNLREGADDAGALEHRTDIMWENREKGSLATYAGRYVLREANKSESREQTWYATHHIRRINWFGLPPIIAWREIGRVKKEKCNHEIRDLWEAVHDGDYAEFVNLAGGFGFGIFTSLRRISKSIYKEVETRYKEIGKKFDHIIIRGIDVYTHTKSWVIARKKSLLAVTDNYPREEQAPPSVNNNSNNDGSFTEKIPI